MKNAKNFYCLLLFVFTAHLSFAQSKVRCAGIEYIIPKFKADTIVSFNNKFVKDSILTSIKDSNYDIEIRYNFYGAFGWWPNEGHCLVIRGNKDSLFAIDYFLKAPELVRTKETGTIIHKYDFNGHHIKLFVRKLHPDKPLSAMLQSLIDNHIMDLPADEAIISMLKNKNVKLKEYDATDCCASLIIEVKVKNHFRNFDTNYYYQAYNQNIKELKYESGIDSVFRQLIPNLFQ